MFVFASVCLLAASCSLISEAATWRVCCVCLRFMLSLRSDKLNMSDPGAAASTAAYTPWLVAAKTRHSRLNSTAASLILRICLISESSETANDAVISKSGMSDFHRILRCGSVKVQTQFRAACCNAVSVETTDTGPTSGEHAASVCNRPCLRDVCPCTYGRAHSNCLEFKQFEAVQVVAGNKDHESCPLSGIFFAGCTATPTMVRGNTKYHFWSASLRTKVCSGMASAHQHWSTCSRPAPCSNASTRMNSSAAATVMSGPMLTHAVGDVLPGIMLPLSVMSRYCVCVGEQVSK